VSGCGGWPCRVRRTPSGNMLTAVLSVYTFLRPRLPAHGRRSGTDIKASVHAREHFSLCAGSWLGERVARACGMQLRTMHANVCIACDLASILPGQPPACTGAVCADKAPVGYDTHSHWCGPAMPCAAAVGHVGIVGGQPARLQPAGGHPPGHASAHDLLFPPRRRGHTHMGGRPGARRGGAPRAVQPG
jgi:hypothetical protein